jgi:hypothetical protein
MTQGSDSEPASVSSPKGLGGTTRHADQQLTQTSSLLIAALGLLLRNAFVPFWVSRAFTNNSPESERG